MTKIEIISIVLTFVGLFSIGAFFTILFKHYASEQIKEIKCGNQDDEIIEDERYNRNETVKKRRKRIKLIKSILSYTALIIIVPTFIFSLISRVSGNVTMIGDTTLMVVASGSMSEKHEENNYLIDKQLNNQFQTYDIIILEKVNSPDELLLHDVIAFINDEKVNVIHRIIDIEDGKYETRGDANDASDKYHPTYSDVIGRYTGKRIPGIGIFIMFLQSYFGIITILSLLYCLIMFDKMSETVIAEKNKRSKALGLIIDYDSDDEIEKVKDQIIIYRGNTYRFGDSGKIEKIKIDNNEVIVEGIIYNPQEATHEIN